MLPSGPSAGVEYIVDAVQVKVQACDPELVDRAYTFPSSVAKMTRPSVV
jgi:hypothetical protein